MLIGIYGFSFTKEVLCKNFKLLPLYKNVLDIRKISENENRYYLTGFMEIEPSIWNDDFQFDMESVLTFVQSRDVLLANEFEKENLNELKLDEEFINAYSERRGNSPPFDFHSGLMTNVINKLYEKIVDKKDKNNREFRSLVFKSIEEWRMRNNYIEITYFLLFSGLEAFAKSVTCLYSKKFEFATSKLLNNFSIPFISDFNNDIENLPFNLIHSETDEYKFYAFCLKTYSSLRNALFHQNKFEAVVKIQNKPNKEVSIPEYEFHLRNLVNLVILKYIEMPGEHIRWNSWADRFGFIK